jgi:hypothetical protein
VLRDLRGRILQSTLGTLFPIALLALSPPFTQAQYMYLDSNGDGIHTEEDRVLSVLPTVFDIWVRTSANRDSSAAACSTNDGVLTINSYEFNLSVVGGTVEWGTYNNTMATITTSLGRGSSPTEYHVGYGGGTLHAPGTYRLGQLSFTVLSGSPEIQLVPITPLAAAFQTSFGSQCSGADADNTLKLGSDWQDTDGLGPPLGGALFFQGNVIVAGQAEPESAPMTSAGVDSGCPQNSVACDISPKPSSASAGPMTGIVTSRDTLTYVVQGPSGFKKGCLVQVHATSNLASEINTGGHCHNPTAREIPMLQPTSGNTGGDGLQFKVIHTWPEAAGRYHIFLEDAPGDTCGEFQTIFTVCVRREPTFSAGMTAFPGPGPGYELTHGPDNVTRHPDHHYGTPKFNKALMDLAVAFRDSIPGVPILGYNDMSLRWGGVFDVDQARVWLDPHKGHRNGDMVDMRTHVNGVARYTRTQLRVLRKIVRNYGIKPIIHRPPGPPAPHWHLQPLKKGSFN